tara:strand:+ start:1162 stop:1458 length:297 start_codon:yes stop_codon:yes gene_type:complete
MLKIIFVIIFSILLILGFHYLYKYIKENYLYPHEITEEDDLSNNEILEEINNLENNDGNNSNDDDESDDDSDATDLVIGNEDDLENELIETLNTNLNS